MNENNFVIVGQKLKFKALKPNAKLPAFGSTGAACADLYSANTEPIIIPSGKTMIISTGLAVEIPERYEMQIRCRSGFASKGIMLANGIGTIDADYRGEIGIILYNSTDKDFTIEPETRIAQCSIKDVFQFESEFVDELTTTERGSGGFGSTGIK